MNKIKRNNDLRNGSPDGVEADIECVVTEFERTKEKGSANKGVERSIKSQTKLPCNIKCAYSDGVIGFSVRDMDMMLTVGIVELIEILKEASVASRVNG